MAYYWQTEESTESVAPTYKLPELPKKKDENKFPPFKSTFTVPPVRFGDYTLNIRKLMDEMKQKEAGTGIAYSPQVTEAIAGEAMGMGGKAASEAVMARKEDIFRGKQIEIAEAQTEQQRKIAEAQLKLQKEQGGGGGTVICTELYYQGMLPEEIFLADCRYGEIVDLEALQGYRILAYPLVKKMKESKLLTKVISYLAIPTAYEFAHRVDPSINGTIIGKAILFIGTPICKVFFRITRRVKWAIS